jgi:hypothetical protein
VSEPRNLSAWAPGAPAGLDIRVSRELGTVDFVAGAGRAYSRVLPNGRGTEYLFTRFFAESTPPDEIARDDAVIAQELETVRQLTT